MKILLTIHKLKYFSFGKLRHAQTNLLKSRIRKGQMYNFFINTCALQNFKSFFLMV